MTTLIQFAPNNSFSPPFSTPVTLDSASYTCNVVWNVSGQRWYMSLVDSTNTAIWTGAMLGSPLNFDILLAVGVFTTSTILYREDTGNIEVNP